MRLYCCSYFEKNENAFVTSTESINWASIVESLHIRRMKGEEFSLKNDSNFSIDGLAGDWTPVMSSDQAAVYYSVEHSVFAKIFYETRLKHRIKNLLIPSTSRHKRFIDRTNDLHRLNIPTPKIIASGVIENNGYVVSEAFPGMGLGSFLARYLSPVSKNKSIFLWRREAINKLSELIASLHSVGVAHGDLRPNNILLDYLSKVPSFCFIDNERNSSIKPPLTEGAIIKNLVQLNMIWLEDVCLTDRFRFIVCYFENIDKTVYPNFKDSLYQKKIIRAVQTKTVDRLIGKSKDGYRKSVGFEPFIPDVKKLVSE